MMFDEYDDYFQEPSQVDDIIQTALSDLKNLFTDEVKSTIEEAKSSERQLNQLQAKLSKVKFELRDTEKTLAEMKMRMENAELYDVPRQYIERFVRNATGDYAPGDTVWVHESEYEEVECSMCKGEKEVTVMMSEHKKKIRCPECSGYGRISKIKVIIKKETITDICLKLCFRKDRVNYWSTDNIYVGSPGRLVSLESIYPTEEAAQAALAQKEAEQALKEEK